MTSPSPSSVRRTAANAVSLVGAYVVGRGLAFVSVVVAARLLGAEDFGAYGTAAALAVMLSLVSTLGMVPLLVREMARDPGDAARWLAAADRVKHGSNALMLLALAGLGGLLLGFGSATLAAAMLLGAGYALGSYAENRLAWSRAVERMSLVTSTTAVYGLVTGVLGVAAVWATGSVVVFCAAAVVGQGAALLWLAKKAPAELRGGQARPGDVGALVRAVVPFAGAFIALTLFYRVDILILERLRTRAEVGLYAAAFRFIDLTNALTMAAVGAVYPALVRHAHRGGGSPGWVGTRLGELVLLASVPAGAALLLAREPVMVDLFGGGYAGAVPLLLALAPAIPALAFNLYAGYLLGAGGRMGWMAALYAVAACAKVALDVWLIPAHGAMGAAWATLLTEVTLALGFALVLTMVLNAAPRIATVGRLAGVAVLAAGAAALPASVGGIGRGAALMLAVVVFYRVSGVLTREEWAALRGAAARPTSPRPTRVLEGGRAA